MTPTRLLGLAALALCFAAPAWAADDCGLQLVTSMPMGVDSTGGVYVPMTISGKQVNLLIDTAGVDSMLTDKAVDMLGLVASPLVPRNIVVLFGGARIDSFAVGSDIVLGSLTASNMRFLVMPSGHFPPELQGTLAPDVLRVYDDDFDFAGAKFNLISPNHCSGQVVYWTHDAPAEIDFRLNDSNHITFPVMLDGKEIEVEMDTGASRSVFSLEDAERLFGFDKGSPELAVLQDAGFDRIYKYPFKTLTFGGVTVIDPDIVLFPDSLSRQPGSHMIIGMGVLRQLHLYIAYREQKLYVTPAAAH